MPDLLRFPMCRDPARGRPGRETDAARCALPDRVGISARRLPELRRGAVRRAGGLHGGGDPFRADRCDTCRTYLKTIDLTGNRLALPLVDDIASVALDLWAVEQGYRRLRQSAAHVRTGTPPTAGLEGRSYEPARDGPRRFPLILRPVSRVGGNCFPPRTMTACHTSVTPQPFVLATSADRLPGGRDV